MEEKLTIKQVLVFTRDMLRGIGSVPLNEVERIGVPVNRAIINLDECIRVLEENDKKSETLKERTDKE